MPRSRRLVAVVALAAALCLAPRAARALGDAELAAIVAQEVKHVASKLPTGWHLDASAIEIKLMTTKELSASMRRESRGALRHRSLLARLALGAQERLTQPLFVRTIEGMYRPTRGKPARGVLFVNKDKIVGEHGLRSMRETIRHELVHAAQHQSHPEVFEAHHALGDRLRAAGLSKHERADLLRQVVLLRTLMEGQAMHIAPATPSQCGASSGSGSLGGALALVAGLLPMASKGMRDLTLAPYVLGAQLDPKLYPLLWSDAAARELVIGKAVKALDSISFR
ncbi:MAG: hypothetical protein KC503_27330, partial [Myxococcales bacterium]|nr:hypothetical protein [Myxococcales bacterium]